MTGTIDTSRVLEVRRSIVKLAGITTFALAAAVACAGVAVTELSPLLGSIGLIVFGAMSILLLWCLSASRGPVLTFAPQGFRDARMTRNIIPWQSIRSITTERTVGNHELMVLVVDPAIGEQLAFTRRGRFVWNARGRRGQSEICTNVTGLRMSFDALLVTANAYLTASRALSCSIVPGQPEPTRPLEDRAGGRFRIIDTVAKNLLFRWTSSISTPVGALVLGVVLFGLMFGISHIAGIKRGSPQEDYLIDGVLGLLALLIALSWVSQISRTVGPFGSGVQVRIRDVTAALRKHRVKMPWFSYVRPASVGTVALMVCGLVTSFALLAMYWPEAQHILQRSTRLTLAAVVAGTFFVVRYFRRSAEAVLAATSGPPTVLLRSFRDDTGHAGGPFKDLSWTFEQMLGFALRPFGPLVAIGKPGEQLPPHGAARTYRTNDTWQGIALDLMATAKLIVMIAGTTTGLQWELDRILEHDWQDKLLIVLPSLSGADQDARLRALSRGLAGSRWQGCLSGLSDEDIVAMRLEPNGSAVVIRAHGYRRNTYLLRDAIRVALYDLWCQADAIDGAHTKTRIAAADDERFG